MNLNGSTINLEFSAPQSKTPSGPELLRKVKVPIMERMSEDEIGEIRDELRAYKEKLDALKVDIQVLTLFSNHFLIGQIRDYVEGYPRPLPDVKEKCIKFLERNGSLTKD
jgi:hypothetical protein